jgi:hypothetical protein
MIGGSDFQKRQRNRQTHKTNPHSSLAYTDLRRFGVVPATPLDTFRIIISVNVERSKFGV